jgi:hypothetical protein
MTLSLVVYILELDLRWSLQLPRNNCQDSAASGKTQSARGLSIAAGGEADNRATVPEVFVRKVTGYESNARILEHLPQ